MKNILLTLVIAVLGAIGVYRYLPLDLLDGGQPQMFCTTITTIAGRTYQDTERLQDSP